MSAEGQIVMLRFGQIDATDLAQSTVTGSAEPDYIFINPPFGKGQKEQKHETQDRT